MRAAALVTLGLGAAGCDDAPPPDLPGQTEARLDACRAAHRRLGEDPARCDLLEQVIAREHGGSRPHFTTVAACETIFGRGACEGETLAATPPNWRPVLAGWARAPDNEQTLQPVVQDREARFWALPEPTMPPGGTLAMQAPPRAVPAIDVSTVAPVARAMSYGYLRLAPIYPDEASCSADWQRCERSDVALPNRYAAQDSCNANWGRCVEVELPDSALTMAVVGAAAAQAVGGSSGGTGTSAGSGSRPGWWIGYNAGYRQNYANGIGPRYQGWSWTANRSPTATYRPAVGTGPLRAWDSGTRQLDTANRMGGYSGGSGSRVGGTAISRPTSSISRAGFGSTGASYSSGG